ncbi:hypothetical protein HZH68_000390 [Vespula germanica]|uniref:C2H2-type domain-containing protein n=1 Tax=Vespula germanica TaxID=30212 RepID=A0A834U5Z9_VESGE|nr:hypothetical protein HZH68_000390 [Vespula germanica]
MAIALSNTTHSIKHEEIQCSNNIKILQKSLCKPVSVVLQCLSQEIKNYLYTIKNQYKSKIRIHPRKHISRKFKEQELQLSNDISDIFDINDKPENTFLNLINNVYVNDELDNERKNSDQRINKNEVLQNVQPVVMLSNQVILNQVDENKLKSRKKIQKTLTCVFSPENIIDNNICKQNNCGYDDIESIHSLPKTNDELPSIKEANKNEKCLDKRKYKRKYMFHEESNDIPNSIKNQRKRKKKTELHHKDPEGTIILNYLKPTNNKVIMSNLHLHAPYSNITDSKVILTKLENIYDDKYIINWKKKYPQQFLLFQNLESIEQHKHFPINILPTKTIDNSHKDFTKQSNISTELELNSCILPSKYEQPKNSKVLLVKLEKLGISLKEQNVVSKVEHSIAQYIDYSKINFFNHSSNVFAHNSEVSSAISECINEALAKLNPFEKEVMIKYLLSKHATSNALTIQLEQNSSSSKRILQDVYNLEKFSQIFSCENVWLKSTENMKYPEICTSSIYEIEGTSNLSKLPQIIQDEIISPQRMILKTHLQRYLERFSRSSSLAEVNSMTVSDEILKRSSKLKEIQILPLLITEQNISPKNSNETLKLISAIDYENITILQNYERTLISNDEQNALQMNTDQGLSRIEDLLPQFIVAKSSSVNNITNESIIPVLKETATDGIPVNNNSISTESSILYDVKNSIQDTGLSNETSINNDSRKIISDSDITKIDVSDINVPKSVQIEEIQSKINTSDNSFFYECIACGSFFPEFKILQSHLKKCLKKETNSVNDNDTIFNRSKCVNILENSKCDDIPELNSLIHQQESSALGNSSTVLSTFLMFPSISPISKSKIKKINHDIRQKDKRARRKLLQYNNKNTRCTVCSEVFDSMMSLSKHIYGHTEKELQKAYEIAKRKQRWKSANDSDSERTDMNTIDSSEKTQTSESSSTLVIDSTTVESLQTDLENKKDGNTANKIISMEKMRQNESKEIKNSLDPLAIETNKHVSMKISKACETKSIKFCACHKNEFGNKTSIELVLLCNICNILFQTRECFEAHFENVETYLCNAKRLTSRVPKLYCSVCQVVLYSFIGMRQHMENHLKNFPSIKLFCHVCKVRFIGMGPIFNLHWFNHTRNICYVASASNFPKLSIVDPTSEEWSIITSDQFKYLIVTEHVCSICNAQCFSKNQLKYHMSSCTENSVSKLPSIISTNNHENEDIQSELNLRLFCNICNLTFSQKSLYEKHVASHKNNLQSEYIYLSGTDVNRTYICNICANIYENLKEFMIHWQDHNLVRETFMCNKCKKSFIDLETYVEHSKKCNISIINVENSSYQEIYHKMDFTCKICNLTFDSDKTLCQHTSIHHEKFPNLDTIPSNNACNDLNLQKISLIYPTKLERDLIAPIIVSTHSTDEITTNSTAPVNKSISEVPENNSTINQSIDSLKLSTNSGSVESSTVDKNLENLSSVSDTEIDDSNATKINNFLRNNRPSVLMNKSEKEENTTAINNSLDKYDNRKDLNNRNTVIVKSPDLKKNDVLDNPLPSENIDINEKQDDVILIEPNILKETVKPMTSLQSNNSTEKSEEPIQTKKYLRVKNISELMDQNIKYNFYNKNDQDGNTNIPMSSSMAMNLSNQKQTKKLNVKSHKNKKSSNDQQKSVKTTSGAKVYKMIIIDHSPTKKQAAYVPYYESERPKQSFVVPPASVQKTRSIPQSAQGAVPILALQLAQNTTLIATPESAQKEIPTLVPQLAQKATSTQILALQSAQKVTQMLIPQSAQRETPTSPLQSAQRETLTLAPQLAQKTILIPTQTLAPQSAQKPIPTLASQSAQKVTLTTPPKSAQRETLTPASQLAQTEIPIPTLQSEQRTTSIPLSYSIRTPAPMPILRSALLSVPSLNDSCTAPLQIPDTQYSNIKPFTTNSCPMNPRITAATYTPSIIREPQNMTQNRSLLIAPSSSVSTNSSTNNYMSNTYIAQRNNTALSKTAPTSMISNLQSMNDISYQNLKAGQPHDTHSTIKLQNAVHNRCSNRSTKVMPIVRSRNTIKSYMNNGTSSLPVSSDQNHYNNSNIKYTSMSGGNLTIMQTQYFKQNNNRINNVGSIQKQSNTPFQMSTFCQPVIANSHSVMSPQQPLVHYQPNTSVANSQFVHSLYMCHFCPKVSYFSTVQELDYHLNVQHNFFCNICNERLYTSNDLDIHKLQHDSSWF